RNDKTKCHCEEHNPICHCEERSPICHCEEPLAASKARQSATRQSHTTRLLRCAPRYTRGSLAMTKRSVIARSATQFVIARSATQSVIARSATTKQSRNPLNPQSSEIAPLRLAATPKRITP